MAPEVAQTAESDPWGWEIKALGYSGSNTQNYVFQKQERINDFDLGINWFKYRPFDGAIGRGWQVDRLAAKYAHNSVYAFSENKVTGHVELDGLESVGAFGEGSLYLGGVVAEKFKLFGVGAGVKINGGSVKVSRNSNDESFKIEASGGFEVEVAGFGFEYEGTENLETLPEGTREFTDTYTISLPFFEYAEETSSTTDNNLKVLKSSKTSSFKALKTGGTVGAGLVIEGEAGLEDSTQPLNIKISDLDLEPKISFPVIKTDNTRTSTN